ncbi:MAG: type II toxin-antitoxin system YafQ family toxin [Chloroflexota bacterium]|nr:type II toxin-antitoxin system YafQ family toxin [Chloroflexota bacterium]
MPAVSWSNRFARDYKRAKKGRFGPILDQELRIVSGALAAGQPLAPRHQDHALSGVWLGSRDCHLKPDLLLIYRIMPDMIEFLRLGSYAEHFG